jgi:hypothetical protein
MIKQAFASWQSTYELCVLRSHVVEYLFLLSFFFLYLNRLLWLAIIALLLNLSFQLF